MSSQAAVQRYGLEVARVAREAYGFQRVETPEPFQGAHQRRHYKLVVPTEQGRFLAKTYRRDPVVLDALRFQHRLADHLLTDGLPAPRIQHALDGRRIVDIGEEWALELQELIAGAPMTVNPETLYIAADALGRFHESCRYLPRPPRDARKWRFSEVPRQLFSRLYERACAEEPKTDFAEECNAIALFLHEAAQNLAPERRAVFEAGLIHGDWHGGNLLFKDGKLAGIVDLEFAGDGCYLEDLAYGISNLCIRTSTDPQRLQGRTELFLRGYQRRHSLSYYEEAALYYAVGVKHVATVAYQLPQLGGAVAGITGAEWMRRLAAQCGWLKEKADGVRRMER
jgi:Ser/Thr protein kinase RdoA (MazF antagonist)